MPRISVILPVYNVESYLCQCLDSVLNQTFSDIEIIPINDGSPDSCGEIIERYAAEDNRLKPIHQTNGGYGRAINAGMAVAKGDYIAIVETDDWIEPDMLQLLHDSAVRTNANIVKGSFNKIYDDGRVNECSFRHITNGVHGFVSPNSSLSLMLYESSIWSALYKREFLTNYGISMLETKGAAYQDVVWKFMAYSLASEIYLLNRPVYNYRVFAIGSSSASKDKALAMFSNYENIRAFMVNNHCFDDFLVSYYVHQIFDCVFHANRLSGPGLKLFYERARDMIYEAEASGVFIENLVFDCEINHYVQKEVLPLYRSIRSGKVRYRNMRRTTKNVLRAKMTRLRRYFH